LLILNDLGITLDWIIHTFQNITLNSVDLFNPDNEYYLDIKKSIPITMHAFFMLFCSKHAENGVCS